jgi:5'-deoxynucleotidase YfbR-like HD superfamily hydrolase
MKIFLSHSSYDKTRVKRIGADLKSQGFEIWFDDESIRFGESITGAIGKGLNESDVLLVFLSKNAVESKWVVREWQSKYFLEMNRKDVSVIPVMFDQCDVPALLADLKRIDFIEESKYETSFAVLLRALEQLREQHEQNPKPAKEKISGVLEYTIELLDELEDEFIALPFQQRLPIVKRLKKIPRSGKKIRLDNFRPPIRIRTVYDHLLSTAHTADCLLPKLELGVPPQDFAELARCIAFHELNEIVLGDLPSYTQLSDKSRKSTRNYAESRLRSVEPAKRERIANEFIWLFLGEKQRSSLETVMSVLDDTKSPRYIAFKLFDKIDPIVSTWRYLHHYRGKLGENARNFNRRMKDFYENPDVKNFVRDNKLDFKVSDLVSNLQDRSKSWEYYEDPNRLFGDESLFAIGSGTVRSMIEGIDLFSGHEGSSANNRIYGSGVGPRHRKSTSNPAAP